MLMPMLMLMLAAGPPSLASVCRRCSGGCLGPVRGKVICQNPLAVAGARGEGEPGGGPGGTTVSDRSSGWGP